jgi:hypothetical protein
VNIEYSTERSTGTNDRNGTMNAFCPACETELDLATGICPACRWDPSVAATVARPAAEPEREVSLTERYRGTTYVAMQQAAVDSHLHVSRGRSFVIVALVAAAGLYGAAMSAMGVL